MALQLSVTIRNNQADQFESTIGTAPLLRLYTGAPPADTATAASGTLLAEMTLPSDWLSAASAGVKTKVGTWSDPSANATGTAGHFRAYESTGTTCHAQGTATMAVALTTSALTAANGNVLTFASTTGAVVGMNISGTGVPADTTAVAVTGTTITMSRTSTAGVASSAAITLGGDMILDNTSIASAQLVAISAFTHTIGNA